MTDSWKLEIMSLRFQGLNEGRRAVPKWHSLEYLIFVNVTQNGDVS